MEKEKFFEILKCMYEICEKVNRENEENGKDDVTYEVLQFSDLAKKWNSVHKVADFYNDNWLGNRDFMHIPEFEQILENCKKYPIIIARGKNEEENEILGISTIKYNENTEENVEPYFPYKNAKYFAMTGVLVKKGTCHRGMGKKIYEVAIRSAHEYNKTYPNTRIMCEIDCRNEHSLRAVASAVENINNNELVGKGKELPANIVGGYELIDTETNRLKEAPTLILEIGLNEKEKTQTVENQKILEYELQEEKSLLTSLRQQLKEQVKKHIPEKPYIYLEGDSKYRYYNFDDNVEIVNTKIIPNGTEQGNDRTPDHAVWNDFIGPIENISIENFAKKEEREDEAR